MGALAAGVKLGKKCPGMPRPSRRSDPAPAAHASSCAGIASPGPSAMTAFLDGPISTPLGLVLALLAAFFVGLSKGGLPVVGMLSVPILALAMPPLAASALILPIYVASDMVGVYLYRHRFNLRNLAILTPASFAGVAIGWATVSMIPDRAITLIIGLLGLLFCLDGWRKRRRPVRPRPADVPRGVFWGVLSGLSSFVSHAGGPPYQMYVLPQKLEKLEYAGTTTILFALVNALKLVFYAQLGQISLSGNLKSTLTLVPISVAAAFLGAWATRRIDETLFFRLVELVLLLSSLLLVAKALRG